MKNKWECPSCNGLAIVQITSGQRVSNVVSVTVDGGLTCSVVTFLPLEDDYATFYRCKSCLAILPFANTEDLIKHLQGEDDGKKENVQV